MNSLKGRTALVTGVSRKNSIGFGIIKRLASEGSNLYLQSFIAYDRKMSLDIKSNEPELIQQELKEYGISIGQMEADFAKRESPLQVINAAIDRFDHIDILILNHTYDSLKTLDELTAEEIDQHFAVNVRATLLLIQHYVKQHNGSLGGRVILLTSGQHLGPMPHMAYVASKGALHQLTKSLADEFMEKGITVNTVNPGPTKTYRPNKELDNAVLKRMPLGRWGEPDDAARLICWLVSDDAEWITGQIINSEGGFRRG